MGGSIVLNPSSRHHAPLKAHLAAAFHNELFAHDAATLLANSADYLARSAVLNRNALALATYLDAARTARASRPAATDTITRVLYPTTSDTLALYDAFKRPATPDFTPGYGCLLSVEFADRHLARAFYDSLAVHHGPHLGAHLTLALPFNELIWGADEAGAAYHGAYGVRGEQIRVSVGLEDEAELIETFRVALDAAVEEQKKRGKTEKEAE